MLTPTMLIYIAILRLRIGHNRLRNHMYNLNIEDSPNCECGNVEDTDHVLLECPKYYSYRVILRQALFRYPQCITYLLYFTLKSFSGPFPFSSMGRILLHTPSKLDCIGLSNVSIIIAISE